MEPEVAQAQVDELPRSSLLAFPELGHFGPLEGLATVAEAVAAALAAG